VEYFVVAIAALFVSGLTMFSGFGLGTLLMPVFALFFPVHTAVAATAVVHGANNVLKASLLGKDADWGIVLRFGLPALLVAFLGAATLGLVSSLEPLFTYSLGGKQFVITPIKLLMGLLMLVFALFELLPRLRKLEFDRKYLALGGVLSGFFGGLSGHQGALRSAFLAKVGISTQAFVGTNAVIGLMVDMARLVIYGAMFLGGGTNVLAGGGWLIVTGCLAAFCGVLIGKRFIRKITMKTIQTLTGIMLLGIALTLGAGIV
jgi:uncharacterized membrane protein YfcA